MLLKDFDYNLKPEMIAQQPPVDREASRLLVLKRADGKIEHRHFNELPEYLQPDDMLVMNDTKVTAQRLRGHKPTGAKVEALLLREIGHNRWDAVVKPGRRVDTDQELIFDDNLTAYVEARTEGGGRILNFGDAPGTTELLKRIGETPLPPYINSMLKDVSRYQTVYANQPGSAAAPTAGFHFTPRLLSLIKSMGVKTTYITLHIGIATFRPVRTERIEEHTMHRETISVSSEAAEEINTAKGRIIAVGTTTARALESAATGKRKVTSVDGETSIFITPGYDFKVIDGLITNFHMPKSTLIIMVSAFAGRDLIMKAYEEAMDRHYRFLSFGDAMMIL